MLVPWTLGTLAAIGIGTGSLVGLGGIIGLDEANDKNTETLILHEKNVNRFKASSKKMESCLNDLGKQRLVISKNFKVFAETFEKIKNKPSFSELENQDFPKFDFDEIKNISFTAEACLGAGLGAIGGTAMGAVAAAGTTSAVMALATSSTGTAISGLSGAAATKAALAWLGGGSLAAGGGGIALGTIILNACGGAVAVFTTGLTMAFTASKASEKADQARKQMLENEKIINAIIDKQLSIACSSDAMKKVSVSLCNNVYKPLVMRLKELVKEKQDYKAFTQDEMQLVENNIIIVQILHALNNTPLFKAPDKKEINIEEIDLNTEEVDSIIGKAKAHYTN